MFGGVGVVGVGVVGVVDGKEPVILDKGVAFHAPPPPSIPPAFNAYASAENMVHWPKRSLTHIR